jgi:hypothetical protein
MPRFTKEQYNEFHEALAKKYNTDLHVIAYIRGMVGEFKYIKVCLIDIVVKKLKTAKSERKINDLKTRGNFLFQISDADFEAINVPMEEKK